MRPRVQIRMPRDRYRDSGTLWHVTIVARGRLPLLTDEFTGSLISETLAFVFRSNPGNLLLYVIMPDHLHVLASIDADDLVGIIQRFKSWTSRKWNEHTHQGTLWQISFRDDGVRKTEHIDDLVGYILNNPVRKGLVPEWPEWPWCGGSLINDL